MPAEGTFPQTAEQVSQCLITKEIQTLFRQFELDVAWEWLADISLTAHHSIAGIMNRLRLFLQREIAFFNQALNQLVEHLFELRAFELTVVLFEHFTDLILIN